MSKKCPIYGVAIYMDCLDCDERLCKMDYKYNTVCIGIDQSYKRTGISISADGKLLRVKSVNLNKCKNNSEKRKILSAKLHTICSTLKGKSRNTFCLIERTRLQTRGFISIDYIKNTGALNATIVDVMSYFGIPVYSVDTRCWKSQVIGTSKPENNKYGVPPEKWPTVKWVIDKGFEPAILSMIEGRREKGTFEVDGIKYEYNNDAADSAAISMFYFVGDKNKLKIEK